MAAAIKIRCVLSFRSVNKVDCVWNAMAHEQKPDFVYWRNGRVHLNRRRRQFSRLLAAEVCSSAVEMLDTPCSEVVWRVLATHSICQFPLHFPSRASPCAITFQLDSTNIRINILPLSSQKSGKYPKVGGRMLLRNTGSWLPNHMASRSINQPRSLLYISTEPLNIRWTGSWIRRDAIISSFNPLAPDFFF
jgi:hypothetical protein